MYGKTLRLHNWSVLHSNEALLTPLADEESRSATYRGSMQEARAMYQTRVINHF